MNKRMKITPNTDWSCRQAVIELFDFKMYICYYDYTRWNVALCVKI